MKCLCDGLIFVHNEQHKNFKITENYGHCRLLLVGSEIVMEETYFGRNVVHGAWLTNVRNYACVIDDVSACLPQMWHCILQIKEKKEEG